MDHDGLEKLDEEHVCGWCINKDSNVLYHARSNTYWHKCYYDAAQVLSRALRRSKEHLIRTLPPKL